MDIFNTTLQLGDMLLSRGWMLACAESCTGGGIAAAITDIAGSSQWFDRGFVTYSNQAKQDMLGVSRQTLESVGAVSEGTVKEMVQGALTNSQAQIAVAVSGIAGPSGGTVEKPVGLVYLAWQIKGKTAVVIEEQFGGDRAAIRQQAVHRAILGLIQVLEQHG